MSDKVDEQYFLIDGRDLKMKISDFSWKLTVSSHELGKKQLQLSFYNVLDTTAMLKIQRRYRVKTLECLQRPRR